MWRLLNLSLFLCLTLKNVAATEAVEEDEAQICNIEKLVKTKIGSKLKLRGEVNVGEWCYFVFKHPGDNYQCCYGDKEKRGCDTSATFENQNDTRCLTEEEYSLTRGKATCVLEIKNIGEKAIGFYQVYNSDHQQIQQCHALLQKYHNQRRTNELIQRSVRIGLCGSTPLRLDVPLQLSCPQFILPV